MHKAIGLDFGTTNSAIAMATPDGTARLADFQAGEQRTTTCRSVLYFSPENIGPGGKPYAIAGPQAIQGYLEDDSEGRLIQSMKSHVASRLFTHTTLFSFTFSIEELISVIIRELRKAAEEQFGDIGTSVVVGRPVRFAGAKSEADEEMALRRLQAALEEGGFERVVFEYEPVAAAYHYEQQLDHDELVLIADFGGGTSDFSLLQLGPSARKEGNRQNDILGTDGVPIAGDTFDSRVIRQLIAPELGLGSRYRSIFDRELGVPSWVYEHLERWHQLSFLKTRQTLDMLRQVQAQAVEPGKLASLIHVIVEDLGYQLYQAVERTKFGLSHQPTSPFVFQDEPVCIEETVHRSDFSTWIWPDVEQIGNCVDRLLTDCGVTPGDVGSVFLTGGSSFVPAVKNLFAQRFGAQRLRGGEELTTVARGLALRALEQ